MFDVQNIVRAIRALSSGSRIACASYNQDVNARMNCVTYRICLGVAGQHACDNTFKENSQINIYSLDLAWLPVKLRPFEVTT